VFRRRAPPARPVSTARGDPDRWPHQGRHRRRPRPASRSGCVGEWGDMENVAAVALTLIEGGTRYSLVYELELDAGDGGRQQQQPHGGDRQRRHPNHLLLRPHRPPRLRLRHRRGHPGLRRPRQHHHPGRPGPWSTTGPTATWPPRPGPPRCVTPATPPGASPAAPRARPRPATATQTGAGDSAGFSIDATNAVTERTFSLLGGAPLTRRGGLANANDVWSYPNVHGDVMATANTSGSS